MFQRSKQVSSSGSLLPLAAAVASVAAAALLWRRVARRDGQPRAGAGAAQPARESRPQPLPSRPLLLVLESNPHTYRFILDTLGADYRVVGATDAHQGLSLAKRHKPELIVSDVVLPGMSGQQLLTELRSDATLADVPVVLLTASANERLRVELLAQGAQDFLIKPFSGEELLVRIRNLISSKRAREVLQRELDLQLRDLDELALEAVTRKRELELTMHQLRVAREHAEDSSRLKSSFLGMVSHELRTPVTIFQLQLQRLLRALDGAATDQQRQILERMTATAKRLAQLVDSLLQYARVESGRLTAKVRAFDLPNLAIDVIEELRSQADEKHLALVLHAPGDLPVLHSDPELVRMVLVNLVGNAIKFTEHGQIDVFVERDDAGHRVLVKDTGPGIPAEERTRIFEPFEHIEPTRHKHTPGVGLGLALVREMATALGGRVDLASEPGHGSEFTVFLPSSAN